MTALQMGVVAYVAVTVWMGFVQAHENRRGHDPQYKEPVWWIMLSWPVWVVVVPLQALWQMVRPRRKFDSRHLHM